VIDATRDRVDRKSRGLFDPTNFVFISAPPSAIPVNIDRENNICRQNGRRYRLKV